MTTLDTATTLSPAKATFTSIPYTLRCTLQFLTSAKNLTDMAIKTGVENGMDVCWEPEYFDRALLELLLFCKGNPTAVGLKVCPSSERNHGDVYTLNVKTFLTREPEDLHRHLREELAGGEDASLDDLLTMALMSDASPVDLDFEIVDTIAPGSAHEELAVTRRVEAARI
jgi:hypothetical protein